MFFCTYRHHKVSQIFDPVMVKFGFITLALPTGGHFVTAIKCLVIYHFAALPLNCHKWIYLDTNCARSKQRAANFSQSEEATSPVTSPAMFLQGHDS